MVGCGTVVEVAARWVRNTQVGRSNLITPSFFAFISFYPGVDKVAQSWAKNAIFAVFGDFDES
jgi:hypothetical protein